ncbi:beta-galactosidase [Subtercola boreus]|uniref:Beta-galactosidase n=1 Tax=Subtercola boreus TaxID=120213 RepID=A0A3E0VF97_9MICO|nr:beta-galactosidase [Subtercola boreus]RFA08223.1 beta-galactosidase [Subtercola boreus]TQL54883.1 beta-galactosidase [Subtercola boreus]
MTLRYGGDYNPEQWPEEIWAEDVRLMQEAGVNFVTVGVFSWSLLEPSDGVFEFGWLDRVLDLLHSAGIRVDLATATASPPPWLTTAHPEMLPQDERGIVHWPGSRQQYSPTSPAYRRYAARLVRRMAERYGSHPALSMWHINNEYGCHTNLDYSDDAAIAFRGWLRDRYGDVETLNRAWGTTFWSQRYSSFDEILPPRIAPNFRNPSQLLDFQRFSSDALLECFLMEKAILREFTPDIPITTNFIGAFKPVDYWSWAPHIDVISDDNYYDPLDPRSPMKAALTRDLMRSLGGGRPWLLMEQATSHVQWRTTNARKPTGQMQALSLQAVARGADGINFFQWRQSAAGAEKFHTAMLPHAGTDSRIWRSVVELGRQLAALAPVEGSGEKAQVAIVLDWPSWWASEAGALPQTLSYIDAVESWYEALYDANVPVDFVHAAADLTGYSVVFAPQLYLLPDTAAQSLDSFVRQGGALVLTYFSAIADENDHAHLGGYLGGLRTALGLRIEEFAPLALDPSSLGSVVAVTSERLGDFSGTLWSELVTADTAEVVARFAGGDLDRLPAVTTNHHGRGTAWYVGTQPDRAAVARIVGTILGDAGVALPFPDAGAGIEAVRRGGILFVINHGPEAALLDRSGLDLLTGERSEGFTLPQYGVVALRETPSHEHPEPHAPGVGKPSHFETRKAESEVH